MDKDDIIAIMATINRQLYCFLEIVRSFWTGFLFHIMPRALMQVTKFCHFCDCFFVEDASSTILAGTCILILCAQLALLFDHVLFYLQKSDVMWLWMIFW